MEFSKLFNNLWVYRHSTNRRRGFTIVELLIVVIVIGLLITITAVSYTNVTQRAVIASIKSDLSNASTKLKVFMAENNYYPNSISDCPTPSDSNICLNASMKGTLFSYSVNNLTSPQTFSLTATNGGNIYSISNDSSILATTIPSGSKSSNPTIDAPIADWVSIQTGDHYGNFYDLVSRQYATVNRPTVKTVYDPNNHKIYDVPANYIAINPRSDKKLGSEAVIEEARTNYALNSSFETDSNSDGLSDEVRLYGDSSNADIIWSRSSNSVHGDYAQSQEVEGLPGVSTWIGSAFNNITASAGEIFTLSLYVNVTQIKGCNISFRVVAYNSGGAPLAYYSDGVVVSSPTDGWVRLSFTTPALPADTSNLLPYFETNGNFHDGDSFKIIFDGLQVEKGSFVTSYIPTTTSSMIRAADIVNVQSTDWSSSSGSVFALGAIPNLGSAYFFRWVNDNSNRVEMYQGNANQMHMTISTPTTVSNVGYSKFTQRSTTGEYDIFAGRWNVGTNIKLFINGVVAASNGGIQPQPEAMTGMPKIVNLGSASGYGYINGLLSRFTVYSSALSDTDIATISKTIDNGF